MIKNFLIVLILILIIGCGGGEQPKELNVEESIDYGDIDIGVIADIHYCSIKGDLNNQEEIGKFVNELNESKLDFVLNVGDNISYRVRKCSDEAEEDIKKVYEILNSSNKNIYDVLGDHDIEDLKSYKLWLDLAKENNGYYSFDNKGYHLIALDTVTGGRLQRENGKKLKFEKIWSQGQILEDQLNWLKEDLSKTDSEKIIIFSGQPLFQITTYDKRGDHLFGLDKGREEITKILKESGKEIVAISGDAHVWETKQDQNITHYLVGSFGYSGGEWGEFVWDENGHRMEKKKVSQE